MVQLSRLAYGSGQPRLVTGGRAIRTDDLGQFRAFGLPAGEYYVSASNIEGAASGYAPSYYPGTGSLSDARRIRVGLGQETDTIVFSVLSGRTAKITGVVLDGSGQPIKSAVISVHQNLAVDRHGLLALSTVEAPVQPDGSFTFADIEPGEYVIRAQPAQPSPATELDRAMSTITVTGEDLNGVTLLMSRGGRARGQIVAEDGRAPRLLKPAEVRLTAEPARLGSPDAVPAGTVRDDWSFEILGVRDERRIFASAPAGWTLKSVMYSGEDVTDRPLDFGANGEADGLQIVLTQRPTDISGAVTDSNLTVVKDYLVVVFSQDENRWGFQSRFIQSGRPDQQGRFSIRGLPPGLYWAVAVGSMEPGEETNPETLEQLTSLATSFSLQEGEVRALDLKLSSY